jgi:adenylate cyclase
MYHIAIQFIGRAQFMLGRYEDAEKTFKRRLIRAPGSDITRAFLASLYGHTGRIDDAHRMWTELLEINPEFSVDRLGQILPYVDKGCFERFSDGLAKARLP